MQIDTIDRTDILNNMKIGFWVIEYPDNQEPRMYGDPSMCAIMGIHKELSPEEMYEFWFSRIDSTFVSMITEAVNNLKQNYMTEVRYPWKHPKKGWTFVRCGSYRDETFENGVRLKGFHKDVTDQMEMEIRENDKHEIIDLKRLKIYSSYFIEMCEGAFEIDINSLKIKTIFRRKEKYLRIEDGRDIFSVICSNIHSDDINKVMNIFSKEELSKIVDEEKMVKVEFRAKTLHQRCVWVEAKIFCTDIGGKRTLLVVTYDIDSEKKVSLLEKEKDDILDAFINLYRAIVEVDLKTEQVCVLKTLEENDKKSIDGIRQLEDMVFLISDRIAVDSEKKELIEFLKIEHLRKLTAEKKTGCLDLRFQRENKPFEWIQMKILYLPQKEDKIYIVFGNTDREHILKSIAEKFVYKNSDYFYYLDLRNDYYIRYSENEKDYILPSKEGWGYCAEMVQYTQQHVVPEDRKKVIRCMEPEYIMKRLDREGEYRISFGILDDADEYRRKEIIFRYYDEENKIVLLQRNDITKEYDYQRNQREKFALVEWEANNDGLTGVYNRTGGMRVIERQLLEHQNGAFLVIDLDNFKMINDCMGHLKGDEVLKKCSLILKENLRSSDIIARIGGDEFVVFLKDVKNRESAQYCVENLTKKLQMSYACGNETILVSASIGIALVPNDGDSFEKLYKNADEALYVVKTEGKKGYSFFEDIVDYKYPFS